MNAIDIVAQFRGGPWDGNRQYLPDVTADFSTWWPEWAGGVKWKHRISYRGAEVCACESVRFYDFVAEWCEQEATP